MESGTIQKLTALRCDAMTKLADTETVIQNITFTVPHVLINYHNGQVLPVLTLRQGGCVQVDATITTDWYDTAVNESNNVFRVKARNKMSFGDLHLFVLNDKIEGVKPVSQSCPTASEYMDNVGKEVLIGFACVKSDIHSKSEGKDVYKVVRSTITLP